jgi:glycosyltransferase involved in cell wall biosynthesis
MSENGALRPAPSGHPALRLVVPTGMRRSAARHIAVAIPVRNEVARIAVCLRALAVQQGGPPDEVVLLLNGCMDGTQAAIATVLPELAMAVRVVERDLRGEQATAGMARSLAVREAAAYAADRDILMTTDADGTVAPDWIARTMAAFGGGSDVVCGRAIIDPDDAARIPAHLHADDARECQLAALVDDMAWLIDPDPYDRWPRHSEHSGASIACTVAAWRRAGGIPPIASGEDRAFLSRLQRVDARIRHDCDVRVTVSGRTQGRAAGGMADTIRRRIVAQDEFIDSAIEPAKDRYFRLTMRARARAVWRGDSRQAGALAGALGLTRDALLATLAGPYFGAAWAMLEHDCKCLFARRVRFAELPAQIAAAQAMCARLRQDNACAAPRLAMSA